MDIKAKLLELRIYPDIAGFAYIAKAYEILKDDLNAFRRIEKGAYVEIAKIHGTEPKRVERCIRHAIETAGLEMPNKMFLMMLVHDLPMEAVKNASKNK